MKYCDLHFFSITNILRKNAENIVCILRIDSVSTNNRVLSVNPGKPVDIHFDNILVPIKKLIIKIYFATNSFQFNKQPNKLFKTAFIPGLDNIVDLNRDGCYEIITAPSPLKFASKESIKTPSMSKITALIMGKL